MGIYLLAKQIQFFLEKLTLCVSKSQGYFLLGIPFVALPRKLLGLIL